MTAADEGSGLSHDEDARVLRVAGDIEGARAVEFEAALRALLEGGGGTVDLTGVSYLPSAATGPLMVAVRDARRAGTPLVLLAATGTIADRVLLTMGVEHETETAEER